MGLFFTAVHDPDRHGEPFNAEPNKCAELDWFPLDALPDPTYRYTSAGLRPSSTATRCAWTAGGRPGGSPAATAVPGRRVGDAITGDGFKVAAVFPAREW